jgi:dipeptidyl aminopeptidase/acylaminoacyl peptidase
MNPHIRQLTLPLAAMRPWPVSSWLVAAVALCAALLAGAPPAAAQAAATWTPELSMTVKRVSSVVPSPDGTRVAFVVAEAVMEGEKSEWLSHIHVAQADGSGSRQLTRGEKSDTSPRWSPDGAWIAFISSRSGKANVWRINLGGGEAEQVTDEKGGVSRFEWSPDGRSIAFVMADPKSDDEEKADKEKRDWRTVDEQLKMPRLYVQPVEKDATGKRAARKLTEGNYVVTTFDWSPDGSTIAFSHQPTASPNDWPRADLSLVSVADGTVRALLASPAAESEPAYSPDGTRIAYVASENPPSWPGGDTVHVVAAGGGAPKALAATPDENGGMVGWSADGARVFVTETTRTVPAIYALPVSGGAAVRVSPDTLSVGAASINATGTHVGFVSQAFDKAPEAFVAPLAGAFAAVQVGRVQPAIDAPMGRSEVVSWKAPDGQAVEGILTYPVGYETGARVPMLLIVHGGPAGVFVNSFIGVGSQYPIAAFAARGYAVLRVNPRGSSGYGKAFRHANRADWGGGDYRDLMAGVDHVVSMGVADPDRLGVMGWSYGGFMTSWIVTQTKRFKAASAGAAVTNLFSFTGTADIPGFIPDYFKGEFWDAFEGWRAHSPVLNAKGATTPTLIQHGEADLRVPVSQGYEFYNALKRQGVTTKMTVYPRQPHGFVEPKMTLDAARANLEWFDRFVIGKAPATSAPTAGR